MFRFLITVLLGCVVGSNLVAQAQPPATDGTAEQLDAKTIERLVKDLESRDREQRDEAERQLTKLGVAVLDRLPAITDQTSGELKLRLLRIRQQLDRQRVEDTAVGSTITLSGTMSLEEALEKISEQTGNDIVDYRRRFNQPTDDLQLELELDREPFWSGLDQILDSTGLTLNNFVGEPHKLALVSAGEMATDRYERGVYSGIFRIEATSLTASRDLRNPAQSTLRLGVEIVWEPRVLPILIEQDLATTEIETDTGQTLSVNSQGTLQLPVQPGVAAIDVRLPLSLPERKAQKLAALRGQFTALVPGGEVKFVFDKLDPRARSVRQSKGGLTVYLDHIRRNGGVQQVSIRLRLDQASESLQSHLDWVENNKVKLISPDGEAAEDPGLEKYYERGNEVGYSYLFPTDQDLSGWRLEYTTPAGLARIPVKYELKDIELP